MALVAATAARASTRRVSFLRMTVLLQGKRVFRQPAGPCLRLILLQTVPVLPQPQRGRQHRAWRRKPQENEALDLLPSPERGDSRPCRSGLLPPLSGL